MDILTTKQYKTIMRGIVDSETTHELLEFWDDFAPEEKEAMSYNLLCMVFGRFYPEFMAGKGFTDEYFLSLLED